MTDVIQCPTCSKKYKLPASPPPTFQCKACGTVMDLSAFQAPPPAAVAPAAPAKPARADARAGVPSTRAPGTGEGGRHGAHAAKGGVRGAGARRGRAADEDEDDEDGRAAGSARPKKRPNSTLIWPPPAGWWWRSSPCSSSSPARSRRPCRRRPRPRRPRRSSSRWSRARTTEEEEVKKPPKVKKGMEDVKRPELAQGKFDRRADPRGEAEVPWHQAEIKEYPWPDYVTAEDRNAIEASIAKLANGGRDQTEGEAELVAYDAYPIPGEKFRAVGRLISEFKKVMAEGNDDLTQPMTLARLMVLDRVLRRIDGFQQRVYNDREGIKHSSTDVQAKNVMKRWNWWYDLEKWHLRNPPWDERDDLADPDEDLPEDEELPK